MKKFIALVLVMGLLGVGAAAGYVFYLKTQLPHMITLDDYKPLLVTQVYDRTGKKIGEYSIERRELVPLKDIPMVVRNAFLAAEDASFYHHGGINLVANLRALLVDLRAGGKVQGASTITQQVARSLLLSNEKTYTRKIKEMLLALEMEKTLSKDDILYLYLNQIFLGQNSYGVATACKTYFDTDLKDITLPEAAILAGLPKGPSEMNPVHNPRRAKERQRYVLKRMLENKMITPQDEQAALNAPVKIYIHPDEDQAPYYLETVKQLLVSKLGEAAVFDDGLKVYTSLDLQRQMAGRKELRQGLRDLDKREGYRGPLGHEEDPAKIAQILVQTRNSVIEKEEPYKILQPDGTFPALPPLNLTKYDDGTLPDYIHVGDRMKAVVMKVDDQWGLVTVRFAEAKGLIDFDSMKWARKPDPNVNVFMNQDAGPTAPSQVLKKGDVILIQVVDSKFSSQRISDALQKLRQREKRRYKRPSNLPNFNHYAQVQLEQEPVTQAALLALDQKSGDVITMVGGYDFNLSKLNRTLQTSRQTGSAFKTIVYAAALDKGFTPATQITDAPIVFEQQQTVQDGKKSETLENRWTPSDDSRHFLGDVLFRNALIHSMNVPSVKILEKIGIQLAIDYARRLGIFSPLNQDYTLTLGSSSVTLYEMTKVFAEFGKLGRRVSPMIIHQVDDKNGEKILGSVSLDEKFQAQMKPFEVDFARRRVAYLAYTKALIANPKDPSAALTAASDAVAKFNATLSGEASPSPQLVPTAQAKPGAPAPNAPQAVHPDKESPIFFDDPDQLIKPQTAYVITSLLQGVVNSGTGMRARALGRPVAGKTGTTNDYIDAWFLGYTPDIAAGVWVGDDQAASLGKGEVGARAALPIWVGYMKDAHEGLPVRDFSVPDGIVFANIDNKTGLLATPRSKEIARQAFISGTEPKKTLDNADNRVQDFYKQDLSE